MSYIEPRTKIFQHLDRLLALQEDRRMPPVNVEIDLSNRCNLGCEWCHMAHTHTRGPQGNGGQVGDLIDTELLNALMYELDGYGVKSITWSGGGEPTLHPDFDDIVRFCPLDQGLYTNGTNISQARAQLLKMHMTWVYVSLDAMTAADFRAGKGADGFEAACEAIRNLAAAPGKATVGVGFLLRQDNYQSVARMTELGVTLGADYVQFRPAVIPGASIDWIKDALPMLRYMSVFDQVILDVSRFEELAYWGVHPPTCYWSGLSTVITPDGRIWDCVNKRGFEGAELGDLNQDNFTDIWERGKLAEVNGDCRIMCRGYIPNVALEAVMDEQPHGNFI